MMKRVQKMGEPKAFPPTIKPMLVRLIDQPFSDPKWLFEPKLDGYRVLAFIRHGEVTLRTRNGNDYTGHYPQVATELGSHVQRELVLDGEMVALNEKGLPDFNLIQHSAEVARKAYDSKQITSSIPLRPASHRWQEPTSCSTGGA